MQTLIVHNPQSAATLSCELGIWRTPAQRHSRYRPGNLRRSGGPVRRGVHDRDGQRGSSTAPAARLLSYVWYGDVMTLGLFLWGVQSVVTPTVVVMRRRRAPGLGRVLARMPLYFVAIGIASWVALFDLFARPFHWAKTDHGRPSRNAGRRWPSTGGPRE